MVINQAPGVTVEHVFPEPPPELRTGVPAFLGLAPQGELNEPVRLVLWPQFEAQFGRPDEDSYLAFAVRGFFENGGRLCYVIRLDGALSFEDALVAGLQVLESLDTIDLVCVPDLVALADSNTGFRFQQQVLAQQRVLAHCEQAGDRFAILDSGRDDTIETIAERPVKLRQEGPSGANGALYFPWLDLGHRDPSGRVKYAPPCGHVAGVYASQDEHVGVHQAPANVELVGVLDLAVHLTDAQQGPLNEAGVNCLRAFPGRGLRVWGARTLSREPAWAYVSVRRLFLTAGRWIERTTAGIVFEPNDVRLWVRLERELSAYFGDLFRRGALRGSTEADAYYVKCDAETNPPEVRAAGQVITEIGLAPVSPNEFVVVRLIHGDSGVTVSGPMRPV